MDDMNRRWMVLAAAGLLLCVVAATWALFGGNGNDAAPLDPSSSDAPTEAIDRLGEQGDEEARVRLVELTGSPDRDVALAAVRNLGLQRNEKARRALETVMTDRERDARVRSAAAATLGKFEDVDPAPLARVLARENDARVRRGAAMGLAKCTDTKRTDAVPDLYRALRDPDPRVREWAATGLHRATLMLFTFDPQKDPRTQGKQLGDIRRFLRQHGYLK
jgi:HEAT repeat protein